MSFPRVYILEHMDLAGPPFGCISPKLESGTGCAQPAADFFLSNWTKHYLLRVASVMKLLPTKLFIDKNLTKRLDIADARKPLHP